MYSPVSKKLKGMYKTAINSPVLLVLQLERIVSFHLFFRTGKISVLKTGKNVLLSHMSQKLEQTLQTSAHLRPERVSSSSLVQSFPERGSSLSQHMMARSMSDVNGHSEGFLHDTP